MSNKKINSLHKRIFEKFARFGCQKSTIVLILGYEEHKRNNWQQYQRTKKGQQNDTIRPCRET